MLSTNKIINRLIIASLMVGSSINIAQAQSAKSPWWFGVSGAANLNFYGGTTQRLNSSLIVPTAFHKGFGVRPFGSFLMEYRPGPVWGGMLNIGYDARGGKFQKVTAPCNCPATLEVNSSYITVEPSLRMNALPSNFYFFAGPRVAFNLRNDFAYTQEKQPNTEGELSGIRKTIISAQAGVGYDWLISSPAKTAKVVLSPFMSFHPYFGQDPRSIESWSLSTIRIGAALKFGKGDAAAVKDNKAAAILPTRDVMFSVRAPKAVLSNRVVSETLPLRNSVFFDLGSSQIPNRYVMLSSNQASAFKELQLQQEQSATTNGRSARQLNVYHNILNIVGDRLRSNPSSSISLSGASMSGPSEGKAMAESVKQYLVSAFGIESSRISTEGRTKPLIPSEQPGGTKELTLLREGDRRVDIVSTSPELLMEVGGGMMRPVQIFTTQADPLDSHVIFNVSGASAVLKSWTIDVTDPQGGNQHFGPFFSDQESVPGKAILGNRAEGDYKVVMTGQTSNGLSITKESAVHLTAANDVVQKGFRYSVLFDFNKANSIAAYDKFLADIVSPAISDGSTVIIHGHTDVIGEEGYNYKLSQDRAMQTQKILERALSATAKTNVKFEALGFGENLDRSPFDNSLPEERFYNRTVIIDIIPAK